MPRKNQPPSAPANPEPPGAARREDHSRYAALALEIGRQRETADQSLRLKVTSGSMLPLIRPGDYVVVERAPAQDLRCGDIIVVQKGDYLVTHRLLVVKSRGFLTKGDALMRFDPLVDKSDLVGRVAGIDRDGKSTSLKDARWQAFNRFAGFLNVWQAQAARVGDVLFPRYKSSPGGAGLPPIAHFFSGILRGLLKIIIKVVSF